MTTALISIVLSAFMAGLGAGSWFAGTWIRRCGQRLKLSPIRLYGIIELLIGTSALVVPMEFVWGSRLLENISRRGSCFVRNILPHLRLWLGLSLLPWCACMGATIPVAMFAIRTYQRDESERFFSLLYVANVVGAVVGACLAPLLVELYGFHGALRVGAILNGLIFVSALLLAVRFETAAPVALSRSTPEITGARTVPKTPCCRCSLLPVSRLWPPK